MSIIHALSLRMAMLYHGVLPARNQKGQATSEYGVVILIAIALGLAVLMMFTKGVLDGPLQDLLEKVLKAAAAKIP